MGFKCSGPLLDPKKDDMYPYLLRKRLEYIAKFFPAGWKGPFDDNRVASVAWATRAPAHLRFPPLRMWLVLNKIDILQFKKDPSKFKTPEFVADTVPAFRLPAKDCTFHPMLVDFNEASRAAQRDHPDTPVTIVDFLRAAFCNDGETLLARLLHDGPVEEMEEDDSTSSI